MRVVFRKFPDNDEVIAVLLDTDEDCNPGHLMSYLHLGQHGEINVNTSSQLPFAHPEEYAELKKELEGIYSPEPIEVENYGGKLKKVTVELKFPFDTVKKVTSTKYFWLYGLCWVVTSQYEMKEGEPKHYTLEKTRKFKLTERETGITIPRVYVSRQAALDGGWVFLQGLGKEKVLAGFNKSTNQSLADAKKTEQA